MTIGGIVAGLLALGTAIVRKARKPDPKLVRARFAERQLRKHIKDLQRAAKQLERRAERDEKRGLDVRRLREDAAAMRTAAQDLLIDGGER